MISVCIMRFTIHDSRFTIHDSRFTPELCPKNNHNISSVKDKTTKEGTNLPCEILHGGLNFYEGKYFSCSKSF